VTGFVQRAVDWFDGHGITARRLMTDNAFSYVRNRSLRELRAERDMKQLRSQAYRPRTNGKVCFSFHPTSAREWAYGLSYFPPRPTPSRATLARPLQPANTTQLTRRATAISRVHNLRGQDT
jgi:hypothetical protein